MEEVEKAWPFVVTRNRVLDWRPIIAPGFMVEQGGYYLLTYESAGEEADEVESSPAPRERVLTTQRFGDLTLIFTTTPATRRLLGETSDHVLVDSGGRRIHVTAGLVLTGRHPGAAARWQDRLSEVAQMSAVAFPRFWAAEDETTPPIRSRPVTSRVPVTPRPPTQLQRLVLPLSLGIRRWAFVLIGVGTTLALLLWRPRRSQGDTIDDPADPLARSDGNKGAEQAWHPRSRPAYPGLDVDG